MTAPTLSAPADHQSASDTRSASEIVADEAIWSKIAEPIREQAEAPEAEAEVPQRDERGRFVPKHAKGSTPVDEAKGKFTDLSVITDEPVEETEAEEEAPEAEAEEAPVEEVEEAPVEEAEAPKEERKLATQFKALDREGEVEVPSDLEIEFKAHGELRRMPLDKVVRLAQSGFYNEQLQQEVKGSRAEVSEIRNQYAEMQQTLERQMAFNRALLENGDEFFLQQREEYARRNSPEERARRLEAELIREREVRQREQWAVQAQSFLQGDLEPKVSRLLAEYPSVTDVEAAGWLAPHLKALEVNGVIPPARYGEVARVLEQDLAQWMAEMHFQRSETMKQQDQRRALQLRKAQTETAKAKRALTKAAGPAARPGAVSGKPTSNDRAHREKLSAAEANDQFWKSMGYDQE